MRLNIGCGTDYREGWTNIDICQSVKADVYGDIAQGLDLKDGCADLIHHSDVMEHCYDKVGFINECGRLLKNGGTMEFSVPCAPSPAAFQDHTHVSFWVLNSFSAQYWSQPPPFLGLKYNWKILDAHETEPNEENNVWCVVRVRKLGLNKNYDPSVKTEWQRMNDRIKHLEGIVSCLIDPKYKEGYHAISNAPLL